MTKLNPAEKLAEEIIEGLRPDTGMDWREKRTERIKGQLQPTFDLLKQVHELANSVKGSDNHDLDFAIHEIELLTRE